MKLPCATLAALLLWGSDNATAAVAEVNSSNASFGKNGNSLSNVSREYWHVVSQAQAKDCRVTGNGTKTECKFNAQALLLTENATIQVTVKTNGLQVNCSAINVTHSNEWFGHCDGRDNGEANFVRRVDSAVGGNETLFGSIRVGTEVCQISPNFKGESQVICTDEAAFPPENKALMLIPNNSTATSNRPMLDAPKHPFGYTPLSGSIRGGIGGSSKAAGFHRGLSNGTTSSAVDTIDVLVIWTKEAECKNSRLSVTKCDLTNITENNMRGLIDLAVMETNTALTLSGVAAKLRLVHAYRDADYVESTRNPFEDELNFLTLPSDGKLDSVHVKRSLYGADVVAMIIGSGDSCGLAWSGTVPEPAYMFSITSYSCATGYYSFGHEIAHNFGSNHDKATADACNDATNYNFGYRDPNAAFRSILAYDCSQGSCGTSSTGNGGSASCPRVQRFSNPNFLYEGKPIGSKTEDNARLLNERKALVASFFPAMNCKLDAECNDGNPATIDTCNVATAVCVFSNPPKAPTMAPVKTAPVKSPVKAPVRSTKAPIKAATKAPTKSPNKPPTRAPTKSPSKIPTATWTRQPTKGPTKPPSKAPTKSPTKFPVKAPTMRPTKSPTKSPTRAPTKSPIVSPTAPTATAMKGFMEFMIVKGVQSATWTTVALTRLYNAPPVPVCTVVYDSGKVLLLPAVVRMKNVATTSFEIRLQNPSNINLPGSRDVHCLIVAEGVWSLPDGRRVEATRYTSTMTDRKGAWNGEQRPALHSSWATRSFVVLGQVASYNDWRWSVFWCRGGSSRSVAPDSTRSLYTGKHVGKDKITWRAPETIGVVILESGHSIMGGTGSGSGGGIELESRRGPRTVASYVNGAYPYIFGQPFATKPTVTIVSQVGMYDDHGSWPLLKASSTTSSQMFVAVDEDQTTGIERLHLPEMLDYVAISTTTTAATTGSIELTSVVGVSSKNGN